MDNTDAPKKESQMIHILDCTSYAADPPDYLSPEEKRRAGAFFPITIEPDAEALEMMANEPPGMSYHFILGKYVPTEDLNKEMWVPIEETVLAEDSSDEDEPSPDYYLT